jgi:hypothetical protein
MVGTITDVCIVGRKHNISGLREEKTDPPYDVTNPMREGIYVSR